MNRDDEVPEMRDLFALVALHALLSQSFSEDAQAENAEIEDAETHDARVSRVAYRVADAMLAERTK